MQTLRASQPLQAIQEAKLFFLKRKETKKTSPLRPEESRTLRIKRGIVFWFFFSKKNQFLPSL